MSFNEDDDFADFQNCTFEQDKAETNSVKESKDLDDFADFQNADLVVNNIDHKTDDRNSIAAHTLTSTSSSTTNDCLKFESILKDAFPNSGNNVREEDEQTVIVVELFTDEYKRSLWNQIQNLEESPSLKLKWNKTQTFQNFLSALRINPKNTLKNPHVPIFASSLGLLEPIKLQTNTDYETKEHISSNHLNGNEINAKHSQLIDKDTHLKNGSLSSLHSANLMCDDFDSLKMTKNDKSDQPVNGLMRVNSTHDKLIKNIKQSQNQRKSEEDSNNKILNELPILEFMRSDSLMFQGQ